MEKQIVMTSELMWAIITICILFIAFLVMMLSYLSLKRDLLTKTALRNGDYVRYMEKEITEYQRLVDKYAKLLKTEEGSMLYDHNYQVHRRVGEILGHKKKDLIKFKQIQSAK